MKKKKNKTEELGREAGNKWILLRNITIRPNSAVPKIAT
jgi:hypothetical protein